MELYYQPHASRKKEAAFVRALIDHFSITQVTPTNYPIAETFGGNLDIQLLIENLMPNLPPKNKWHALMMHLQTLPAEVKVFLHPSQISCDVVIVRDGKPHYIEYHEKQHRTLSVDRPTRIYDIDGEVIIVPRYVQRYLRDVWREQKLHPFTVMWDDKFQRDGLKEFELPDAAFQEYALFC